jgi:hypothetical protein
MKKPSDAHEVLAYYNREQYGVILFTVLNTLSFAGLDKDNPYLDKAPNYERDYKTGKIRHCISKRRQNSDDNHKTVSYLECGAMGNRKLYEFY